ncbi:MAG: ligase-associated DNA damage response endonuclease PdeM [Tepidimonas sp.]|nr:ligase-associated DNA damage response endonuclease PdeM [Tepidimonas sp.]
MSAPRAAPLLRVGLAAAPEHELWLLPQRAVWWPAQATLLVADVHLGKGAALRAGGVPVPAGSSGDDLGRLSRLLRRWNARRLVVLGDWLHARSGHTPALQSMLKRWRAQHAEVAIVLVRGNHDRHAGAPSAELGIEVVDEPLALGPWCGRHAPPVGPGANAPALCGHVHPVAVLRGAGRERLRLPCFVLQRQALVLPAFGSLTGGWTVPSGAQTARVVVADEALYAVEPDVPSPWRWLP